MKFLFELSLSKKSTSKQIYASKSQNSKSQSSQKTKTFLFDFTKKANGLEKTFKIRSPIIDFLTFIKYNNSKYDRLFYEISD